MTTKEYSELIKELESKGYDTKYIKLQAGAKEYFKDE